MRKGKSNTQNYLSRIMADTIWPGRRHAFNVSEMKQYSSIFTYDTSYLYCFGVDSEEDPHIGVFESRRFNKRIPYFNKQEELFLQMAEDTHSLAMVVEKPVELVFDEEYTRVFVPDFLVFTKGGQGVVVMLMPYDHFASQDTQREWYALEEYCSREGFGCVIFDMNKGVSLKWIMRKMLSPAKKEFEDSVLKALDKSNSHWISGVDLSVMMDAHGANAYDLQVLVLKLGLLYIPKSTKNRVSLLRSHTDDLFDSTLITTSYLFRDYARL